MGRIQLKQLWADLRPYTQHPAFWGVVGLKVVAGSFFSSRFLDDLFIPFVSYFVDSGFSNPWEAFFKRGVLDAFPYSTTMLVSLSIPQGVGSLLFGGSESIPRWVQLLLMRVPFFVADVTIYFVLCRWFVTKWKSVLVLYWCSPVLFYISYVHGQIDVIPTVFLVVSLWQAAGKNAARSGFFLGLGVAAKFHLVLVAPLIAFFLYKNRKNPGEKNAVLRFGGALIAVTALLIVPWMGSPAYQAMVLMAKESNWIFNVSFQIAPALKIFICPAALLFLLLHFFSFDKVTKDILILYIGLIYALVLVLVQPMPGWSFWFLPFLCYFLIRYNATNYVPFWVYTAAYLVYFLFFADGVAVFPLDSVLPEDAVAKYRGISFTALQSSLGLMGVWMYRIGIRDYVRYKMQRPIISIGIGGDSGTGKHRLAKAIESLFGSASVVRLHGDDYHKWPRGHEAWQSVTHLNPRSNYFRDPLQHIVNLKNGDTIHQSTYDHATGQFTEKKPVEPKPVVLFEGLHPFVFQRLRDIFEMKIFMDTDEDLRRYWKVHRDQEVRGYTLEKVLKQIKERQSDSERYVRPQREFADWIVHYFPEGDIDTKKFKKGPALIKVRHTVSSQIVEVEDLVDELQKDKSDRFHIEWYMEPNLRKQVIEVEGSLSPERVRQAALRIFPDLETVFDGQQQWLGDLDGLNQLVFLTLFRYWRREL